MAKQYKYNSGIDAKDYALRAVQNGNVEDELDALVHDFYEDFQSFILSLIILQIRKYKLEATKETLNSLAVEIHRTGSKVMYELDIMFVDNARFQDFLKAIYTKQPPVGSEDDGLIEWIKSKGLDKKPPRGRETTKIPTNNDQNAMRIAYAIANALREKYDGTKRNKAGGWYTKHVLPESYRFTSLVAGATGTFISNFFFESMKALEIQNT